MDPAAQKNIDLWMQGPYDPATKEEIHKLLLKNPKKAVDAFYTHLAFGTGGLRGLMGVGTNRINRYTIGAASQGLANYINQQPKPPDGHAVFIGFDSRHHSREFAEETARVMAGNGIKAYLYKEMRPSPMISFGCRFKECSAAVMITASHNPPEYNGYKVYWKDGAQILPPHDKNIIAEVQKITSPKQVKSVGSIKHPLVALVGEDIDEFYFEAIQPLLLYPHEDKKYGNQIKIVYTSLHGTGIAAVPKALQQAGFTNYIFVDSQVIPNGDFPTVKSPNPEDPTALKLGIDRMRQTQADLLIATDPDTDRVGVVISHHGQLFSINGNQMACILLEQVIEALKSSKRMPLKPAFIKTIATSELFKAICKRHEVTCFDVLTGFKYIAEKINQWEKDPHGYHYVFGGEESFGYLLGTVTRDKDAVTASVLIAEVAFYAKRHSLTLLDLLHALYQKYGFFYEKLLTINYPDTKAGREQMAEGTKKLESSPPASIQGHVVERVDNYKTSLTTDLKTGATTPLTLPKTDALVFWLDDGSKLMARPSGTEPKIKIYCGVVTPKFETVEQAQQEAEARATGLLQAFESLLKE